MAPARLLIDERSLPDSTTCREKLPDTVPVLIVGGGPTGLLQACLLSRLGSMCQRCYDMEGTLTASIVKSLVVERYSKRLAAPKAHALSPRSLEICRQFAIDTNDIRSRGTPRSAAFWVNFITNLSGQQVGRLEYERMDKEVLNDTPEVYSKVIHQSITRVLMSRSDDT